MRYAIRARVLRPGKIRSGGDFGTARPHNGIIGTIIVTGGLENQLSGEEENSG